jgi:hypothetical protein
MQRVTLKQKIETHIWATPAPDITIRELAIQLLEDGQKVLQIDWLGNRILLHHEISGE